MKKKHCINCGRELFPPFRNPDQKYCGAKRCQQIRRRLWQQQKLATDPEYKSNQQNAQKSWRERNPNYSREYRVKNTHYTDTNRTKQHARNQCRRARLHRATGTQKIAKMDALALVEALNTGTFKLVPVSASIIAKMDAFTIQLTVINRDTDHKGTKPP